MDFNIGISNTLKFGGGGGNKHVLITQVFFFFFQFLISGELWVSLSFTSSFSDPKGTLHGFQF